MRWQIRIAYGVVLVALAGTAFLYAVFKPPTIAVPPQRDIVFSHVNVLNPGQPLLKDYTVEVRAGHITTVRPAYANDPVSLCEGCTLMPGLIDAHVHTPPALLVGNQELFALLYLAHGVTGVRDVGEADGSIAALKKRLSSGELVGPRMARCGPVLEGEPPAWPMAKIVRSPKEANAAVAQLKAEGVDCIKTYNELEADVFAALAKAAAQVKLPLIGHVPHKVGIENLRRFESQHMTGLPYVNRPRPQLGMDLDARDVLDMTESELRTALALAKSHDIAFTPTLANFRLRLSAADPDRFPRPEALNMLPQFWREGFPLVAGVPRGEEAIALHQQVGPALDHQVAVAHAMGLPVLAGTDTLMPFVIPGDALHRELGYLAEAFGSIEDALASATRLNGAHVFAGQVGYIAAGRKADLLLLSDSPVSNLSALRNWEMVMVDGRLYTRAMIDGGLQRFGDYYSGPFYQAITTGVIGLVADQFRSAAAAQSSAH